MDQFFDSVQKQKMFKAFFAVFVLLAVFLGIKSLSSIKEFAYIGKGVYPSNIISVSGKGEVIVVPDIAQFSFSVTEEAKTVSLAQENSAKKINSIIEAVKAMGVEEKDIKTTSYNSYPKYEYTNNPVCSMGYCPPSRQVLTGYEVSQTISIKVRKTEDAGNVLTKVGSLGASNISGLDFVVDDMDKVQMDARDKAIADAKENAKKLSKSLGVKLVKIVSYYDSSQTPVPMAYGMGGMEKSVAVDAQVAPQLPTGENKVISYVTITYEVE